jgi:hypothetical protein
MAVLSYERETMRAGSPTTSERLGTLRVTLEPGAMVAPSPTVMGVRIAE